MAPIPDSAKWYVATLVEEITVEGESRNVVHKNLVLIRAESPDQAREAAQDLGKRSQVSYDNPEGRLVRIRFRGLNELSLIHDELEHGAELFYEELVGISEAEIQGLLRRREELALFRPIRPTAGPDYSSREVIEDAKRLMNGGASESPQG